MSSIYVLEPPTKGRVLLHTSVGNLDIELWSKEAPKACRNFVQLCLEGYYDDTVFHRVVKDFIVQGGDPTGSGEGGESAFGKPFGLELHSRLRFNRRGLLAMACLQPGQNASQFFFTLGPAPELEKHNTIFGQVVGNSLFNMLRLAECETDQQERPLNPQRIISARVIENPFPDVAARPEQLELLERRRQAAEAAAKESGGGKIKAKTKTRSEAKATRNFALLSFGDEAEEAEGAGDEDDGGRKRKKIMSSHDLLNDPKLSSETAPILPVASNEPTTSAATEPPLAAAAAKNVDGEADGGGGLSESRDDRLARLKQEVAKMRRALHKAGPAPQLQPTAVGSAGKGDSDSSADEKSSATIAVAKKRRRNRGEVGEEDKGEDNDAKAAREAATLRMFAKFAARMAKATSDGEDGEGERRESGRSSLFSHVFQPDSAPAGKRVLDPADPAFASAPDRYELDDPRNPMAKRRRQAAADKLANRTGPGGFSGGRAD